MKFDETYDRAKSDKTKADRGIDFVEAREVWSDPNSAEGPGNSDMGEERWLIIGMALGKLWTVCFTHCPEGIRIISVRPPRDVEREVYYG
jgi:uncharacterized DUF497 family protein